MPQWWYDLTYDPLISTIVGGLVVAFAMSFVTWMMLRKHESPGQDVPMQPQEAEVKAHRKSPITRVQINALGFGGALTFLLWKLIGLLEHQLTEAESDQWVLEICLAIGGGLLALGNIAKQFADQGEGNGNKDHQEHPPIPWWMYEAPPRRRRRRKKGG